MNKNNVKVYHSLKELKVAIEDRCFDNECVNILLLNDAIKRVDTKGSITFKQGRLNISAAKTAFAKEAVEGKKSYFCGYINKKWGIGINSIDNVRFHYTEIKKEHRSLLNDGINRPKRNIEAIVKEKWTLGEKLNIAVVTPFYKKRSRTFEDFKAGFSLMCKHSNFQDMFLPIACPSDKESNPTIDENAFLIALHKADSSDADIVAILRGGANLDNKQYFLDSVETGSFVLQVKKPVCCAVGHTGEHKGFKELCDFYMETPSLLGVQFGLWANEVKEKV